MAKKISDVSSERKITLELAEWELQYILSAIGAQSPAAICSNGESHYGFTQLQQHRVHGHILYDQIKGALQDGTVTF